MTQRIQTIPYVPNDPIYGQIVGNARDNTVCSAKFSDPSNNPEIKLERYKVRIFGVTKECEDVSRLPWAKIKSVTSGVGGRSKGFEPILSPNTYVGLEYDDGGNWWILTTYKNVPENLPAEDDCSNGEPASGIPPGTIADDNAVNYDGTGKNPEVPNVCYPSNSDRKQNNANKEEDLLSACKKINTEAVNSEIQKLIQDVQGLRTGLLGDDSFLITSQNFINDVQSKVNNAAASISTWTSWLVQEIRKYVIRKVTAGINDVVGNAPLSTRYLVNEAKRGTLTTVSCLFIKILSNLERLLANALSGLVNRLLNTATCLIESFISQFIGQLINQITQLLNAILGPISSLIGSVIGFANDIIDFAMSILDFLLCKPENICPQTEKWNPLEGGQPALLNLDFNSIFESARGVVSSVEGLSDISGNVDDFVDNFEFSFDSDNVIQNLLDGCNQFTGPVQCGPPNIVFWGGSGSDGVGPGEAGIGDFEQDQWDNLGPPDDGGGVAAGNAVVNAVGDIIGVDLTDFGDYTEAPFISIEDNCGNGTGAIGIPVLGNYYVPPIVDPSSPTPGSDPSPVRSPVRIPGSDIPPGTFGPGITTSVRTGVVDIIIVEPGYGYLPVPDGSTGSVGRTWADRCQTTVQRVNGDYDPPYSEGDVIRLYYGDSIIFPAQPRITIDCDFTIDEIPGAIEVGEKYCFKDMRGFDEGHIYSNPTQIKSMVGFDDIRGSSPEVTPPISIEHQNLLDSLAQTERAQELFAEERAAIESGVIFDSWRPDQFGFANDYPYARELGFNDIDIRFYIEGFYSKLLGKRVGPLMRLKLEDPNFGPIPRTLYYPGGIGIFDCENDYRRAIELGFNDMDIRYYLTNFYTGNLDECMQEKFDNPAWGRAPEYYVSVTAPGCPPDIIPPNSYPVTPIVGDVVIINPGFGYSSDDTADVLDCSGEGESATKLKVDVDNAGRIINVSVLETGTSFACIPEIVINTSTGHNAVLQPIMRFEQPIAGGADADGDVLQVIDCVGKV